MRWEHVLRAVALVRRAGVACRSRELSRSMHQPVAEISSVAPSLRSFHTCRITRLASIQTSSGKSTLPMQESWDRPLV